jgi:hypothetical protein
MAALMRLALLGTLLAAHLPASAAPSDMSRDEIVGLAVPAVDYSYWWGNGCWRTDGTQLGSCSGSCPDCTHSGSYGADCSGFVAKVWQVPSASPVSTCSHPYSTLNFACEEIWWTAISRDALQRGDAAAYRSGGCPGSSGHVVLYERGDPWGSMWTYEARGCSTGIVHNSRTLSSDYRAIRRDRLVAGCTDADGDGTCAPEDCDDGNPGTHPGAAEACGNALDDDCDGATDEDCGCMDEDGDGFCPPDDCHDGNRYINPGAAERCRNEADDDCDGATDENCDCTDGDGDGYCPPDDCNDGSASIHPGADPMCAWGHDDDCDTRIDNDEPACGGPETGDGGCGCAPGAAASAPGLLAVLGVLLGAGRKGHRRGRSGEGGGAA